MEISCPKCSSDNLIRDVEALSGPGIAIRCQACGERWRRIPRPPCPRCGSSDVAQAAVDGWAFDDLETARDDPTTTEWGYVDKVVNTCHTCRHTWETVEGHRPYRGT